MPYAAIEAIDAAIPPLCACGHPRCSINETRIALEKARADLLLLVVETDTLIKAGKAFRSTVISTRGVKGMDDHDVALRNAEQAWSTVRNG